MTTAHPFSTRRGRKLRQAKLNADPLCERCVREDRVTAATQVHHRVPLEQGGAHYPSLDGLEALCDDHHKRTHGARRCSVDPATGLPTGDHWWNAK